jgi:site-specific recombinase XerC
LPCLNEDEVEYILEQAGNIRDRAIISLFADSGIRLNELVNIKPDDIDWESQTVTIMGKGNKQRKALFSKRTADLITEYFRVNRVKKVSQKTYINI